MTNDQKEFLYLCIAEQLKYKQITNKLNVPTATLSKWYFDLKEERLKIADIRKLWLRKKMKIPFSDFYKWYIKLDKKCFYCDITEEEIKTLLDNGKLETKRITTRGKKLELDRKQPNLPYDILDNIVLSCYWCNNAKTDEFTVDEFMPIAQGIRASWFGRGVKRLGVPMV